MSGHNQRVGRWGEDLAARWYIDNGYQVLDQNWSVREGELDLVAADGAGTTVVFCEVKTRTSSAYGTGAEAVTAAKMRQVRKVAALWLQQNRAHFDELRFDVASVDGDGQVDLIEACF